LAIRTRNADAVADQATRCGEFTPFVDRRNPITCGECDELFPPISKERIGTDRERNNTQLGERKGPRAAGRLSLDDRALQ
jgi:hypothetical protein